MTNFECIGIRNGDLKRIIEEIVSVNKSKTLDFNSNEKGLTKQTKNILINLLLNSNQLMKKR